MVSERDNRPKHQSPPNSIDVQKLKNYPNHNRFQGPASSKARPVIAYMGQLYCGSSGIKLKHDIDWLRNNRYTVMPEMSPIILNRVEKKLKTCSNQACGFSKLPSNAQFCSCCGHQQSQLSLISASDDRLATLLKLVDPEQPFAALQAMNVAENPIPRSKFSDFINPSTFQEDIDAAGFVSFASGTPGEPEVATNPRVDKFNPLGNVTFNPTVPG